MHDVSMKSISKCYIILISILTKINVIMIFCPNVTVVLTSLSFIVLSNAQVLKQQ